MSLSFDYTSTSTLVSTFTVPPPSPTSATPVIYSTIPDPDPSAAKLIPVLVVTEYYITVEGGGTVTGYITPNVDGTLPSESGAAATAGTNSMKGLKAIGWESWSGKERWGVLAALGVGIALVLAGAGWLFWVGFGRARWTQRTAGAAKTGEKWYLSSGDKSTKNSWPVGREQRTGSRSRREDTVRRGRQASNTRYQMGGGLGDPGSGRSERAGSRPASLTSRPDGQR